MGTPPSSVSLRRVFDEIRGEFFPRWHRGGAWSVRRGQRSREAYAHGYCDRVRRTVWVDVGNRDLVLVLIHEIAHAIRGGGHGVGWRRRMLLAADRAQALERADLATRLRAEVESYERAEREVGRVTAPQAYALLRERAQPAAVFANVVRFVAHELGMTPREFTSRYTRARAEFERGRSASKREQRLREALLTAMRATQETRA